MDIRAKLSLNADGFKSGIQTAKKELDSLSNSSGKANSKLAKDLRASFDGLGPNLKREGRGLRREFDGIVNDFKSSARGRLDKTWQPLQQGFSKAATKIGVNASVIGGFFRNMTRNAQDHSKAVDSLVGKNLATRLAAGNKAKIADMRNLNEIEKKISSSNRRLAKEAMRAQYGAVDSTKARDAWLAKNPLPQVERRSQGFVSLSSVNSMTAKKKAEQDYTKWWTNELNRRDYIAFWNSTKVQKQLTKNDQKMWKQLLRERTKETIASAAYRAKYELVYQLGSIRRAIAENRSASQQIAADRQRAFNAKVAWFKTDEFDKSLARTRYALYDVGQRVIGFGFAIETALAQAVQSAIKFESAFTSVERTATGVSNEMGGLTSVGEKLRSTLLALATTSPISYEEITKIATLGAQMGIATDSLDEFTKTVSQFSAITGVSVDAAATAFGRLGELLDVPATKFENLSSAITYAGVNSVATEAEILTMSESIAAASNQAGFAADEVIGMATALASLKVRPEEARGVLVRLFRTIDASVSEGGTALRDLGMVIGQTSEDTKKLWQQDPSQFFNSFLQGANAAGTLNETITSLGITNTRELNVIQRLASNTDVLNAALADSHEQYLLGTYAGDAYSKVADDVASKLKMFQSAAEQAGASLGGGLAKALGMIADFLKPVLTAFAAAPPALTSLVGVLVAAVGGIILFKGALIMTMAGLMAAKLAMNSLNLGTVSLMPSIANIRALIASMGFESARTAGFLGLLKGAMTGNIGATNAAAAANRGFMASLGWIGLAITAVSVIATVIGAMNQASDSTSKLGDAMIEAGGGIEALSQAISKDTAAALKDSGTALGQFTTKVDEATAAQIKSQNATLAAAEYADTFSRGMKNATAESGRIADAAEIAADAQTKYNETIAQGNELLGTQTLYLGTNTAAFMTNALGKYQDSQGEVQNFFNQMVADPYIKQQMEILGFNTADMITAGMAKQGGATEYVNGLLEKFRRMQTFLAVGTKEENRKELQAIGTQLGLTTQQIEAFYQANLDSGGVMQDMPTYYQDAAAATDALRVSTEQTMAAQAAQKQVLIDQGYSAEAAGDMVEGLSEKLKKYLSTQIEVNSANRSTADAFDTFASGIKESDGAMDGLSKSARTNMGNFESFMTTALSAATVKGEGFNGAVARMVAALIVMKAAGKDTTSAFASVKQFMVTTVQGATQVAGTAALANQIAAQTSVEGIGKVIDAWILTQDATSEAGKAAIEYGKALKLSLTGSSGGVDFVKEFKTIWDQTNKTLTQAKTALEILQEALDKMFASLEASKGVQSSIDSLGQSLREAKNEFNVYSDTGRSNMDNLKKVIDALAVSSKGNKQVFVNSLASMKQAMVQAGVTAPVAFKMIDMAMKAAGKTGKATSSQIKLFLRELTTVAAKQVENVKRTFSDFADDLKSILDVIYSARYGRQNALDEIADGWNNMKKAADDANESIKDAQKTISELTADRNILEYQLKIAVKYGDTLRADALRSKIAEKTSGILEQNKKIAEAQAVLNPSLSTANTSEQAINNRKAMQEMLTKYNEYLASLAKTGMSNDDLKKKAVELSAEFMKQGKSLGFAEAELKAYADTFVTDFTLALNNTKRDITLSLNSTDPILTAIAEFVTKANQELAKITVIDVSGRVITGTDTGANSSIGGGATGAVSTPGSSAKPKLTKTQKLAIMTKADHDSIMSYSTQIGKLQTQIASKATNAAADKKLQSQIDLLRAKAEVIYNRYATGGYVSGPGTGTSDSIPAMLSNGEYVINSRAVGAYGVDFMNALNQMQVPKPYYGGSSAVSQSGPTMVYLSSEDRALLRAAIDRPVNLYTENTKIAQSANEGNVVLARRGMK